MNKLSIGFYIMKQPSLITIFGILFIMGHIMKQQSLITIFGILFIMGHSETFCVFDSGVKCCVHSVLGIKVIT